MQVIEMPGAARPDCLKTEVADRLLCA